MSRALEGIRIIDLGHVLGPGQAVESFRWRTTRCSSSRADRLLLGLVLHTAAS